jgi:sarcosine oxidase delta subunit
MGDAVGAGGSARFSSSFIRYRSIFLDEGVKSRPLYFVTDNFLDYCNLRSNVSSTFRECMFTNAVCLRVFRMSRDCPCTRYTSTSG